MLMGSSVIDDIRPVCTEQGIQTVYIAHGAYQNHKIQLRMFPFQFLLYFICIILIYVKYNELFYFMARELSAQFTANGSASPCYQDNLILYIPHDFIQVDPDRLPA